MATFDVLVLVCTGYVAFLFLVAFAADRRAKRGRRGWLNSPLVYTLSLSIYCTAWTFYGAVGYAARSGLEFMTIYLGPTIVFIGWWWLLRKLVRIGRTHRITSIADLISSRYGKSNALAVIVTLLAVAGTTPYIALQLQSVTLSFNTFSMAAVEGWLPPDRGTTAFWVAAGLAVFTVLFGTRNLDANEQHHGVVMAIAVEAVVKLVALLAVGGFVVWGVAGGLGPVLDRIDASEIATWQPAGGHWLPLIFLSGAAVICLPRMFQVTVVENADERHLATASWAFPLYLMAMSLFVVPIAVVGLAELPDGSNPDLFVLTLPLAFEQQGLALLAFLGGFSAATSMVIVAAIALSTMVSNHIVMPLWLRLRSGGASVSGDVRKVALRARRISIAVILAMGYTYYAFTGGSAALAAIGLIAFVGVAQVLPSLVGGIFWRGASLKGAAAGLCAGFALWLYTLFLPSFEGSWLMPTAVLADGPFGIGWLRPQALLGVGGQDPLLHAMLWSLCVNTLLFVGVSLASFPSPMERLQGAQFVNVFNHSSGPGGWVGGTAEADDLLVMSQRILGAREARALFQAAAREQGKAGALPDPTPDFIDRLERELAGSVGAATAHAMVGRITGGVSVSVEDLLAVADETAQIMEYSSRLEAQSRELAATAAELRRANQQLTQISAQKDAFLSQISHELRTPMASIRSFSEILRDTGGLDEAELRRYAAIIQDESVRLTRLLDDLLDLSFLENGQVTLHREQGRLADLVDGAVAMATSSAGGRRLTVRRDDSLEGIALLTDCDRLRQVFINLIGNARKYCDAPRPELHVEARRVGPMVEVDFTDNGAGIPEEDRSLIFEKFARLTDQSAAGSAGLGLAICREIMRNLGGSIEYVPQDGRGARFRVRLPVRPPLEAARAVAS